MDAQDNLKIIHTVDGASLQNRYGKSVIQSHDIGLISLPTGEIVMADPTLPVSYTHLTLPTTERV